MLPAIVPILTALYGIASSASAASKRAKQDAITRQMLANRPRYMPSPYAQRAYDDAQSRRYALSPGVMAGYDRLSRQTANRLGYIQRNATSGAMALAAGSDAVGQEQTALPQLAMLQDNYQRGNEEALYRASEGMDRQEMIRHQSDMDAYGDNINFSLGQVGAHSQNQATGMNLAATSIASMMGNMGGKTARRTNALPMPRTAEAEIPQLPVNNNMRMLPATFQQPQIQQRIPQAPLEDLPLAGNRLYRYGTPMPPGWYND